MNRKAVLSQYFYASLYVVLLLCFFISFTSANCEEITVGIPDSTWIWPFATYFQDSRTQSSYPPELHALPACTIRALSIDVIDPPAQIMQNLTIRISSHAWSYRWQTENWTTVYSSDENITGTGWHTFVFTTPYEHTQGDWLTVDISFDNDSSSESGRIRSCNTAWSAYLGTDSEFGDPLTWAPYTTYNEFVGRAPVIKLITGALTPVETPEVTPAGGVYNIEQAVNITCSTPDAVIRYTTNGTDPTETDTVIQSGGTVLVDRGMTLKARAWKDGHQTSSVKTAEYRLVAATPAFEPEGGGYPGQQSVTISCSTPDAVIRCTTDGTQPTEDSPVVQSGASIEMGVVPPSILKARAWKSGFETSDVRTAEYNLSKTVYVKTDGNDSADGLSWETARRTIAAGLSIASCDDSVLVAQGIYHERVIVPDGVSLYGGYVAGSGERDLLSIRTVLDGGTSGDVVIVPRGASVRVDGLTITNGRIGVHCGVGSTPTVTNSIIIGHTTGVFCDDESRPVLTNNMLASNADAVVCFYSVACITNNTMVGNSIGVICFGSADVISNNIVTFNSAGFVGEDSSPILSHNDVYGNDTDYEGISPGESDISVDPLLVARTYGDMRIQGDSPCMDAGDNTAPNLPSTDIFGRPRVWNGAVDIGAYESQGDTLPAVSKVVYVNASAAAGGDGTTWERAYRTIPQAFGSLGSLGGDIWIARGEYTDPIILPPFVHIYGGFTGGETSRDQRNWNANQPIINVLSSLVAVNISGISSIDGFTVEGSGTGITCRSGSPSIANNKISSLQTGIACSVFGLPRISGNTIAGCSTGILCEQGAAPVISLNTISGSSLRAILVRDGSSPLITGNVITGTYGLQDGSGISITSNCFPMVVSNTLCHNGGAGIRMSGGYTETPRLIANNIIAFNYYPIYANLSVNLILRNNCIYGQGSGSWVKETDISVDPMFIDAEAKVYWLQPNSPCIDRGWTDCPGITEKDIYGNDRVVDGIVDIGAYEFIGMPGPGRSISEAKAAKSGSPVFLESLLSGKFQNFYYIQDPDRSSGIRVHSFLSLGQFPYGMRMRVTGRTATTSDGEKYIDVDRAWYVGPETLRPLGMTNQNLGGEDYAYNEFTDAGQKGVLGGLGLNNIGLLITTTGVVTYTNRGQCYFYIDDGSKLDDGSGHIGVKVLAPYTPPTGRYVKVTGIISCFRTGENLHRLILSREWQIAVLPE